MADPRGRQPIGVNQPPGGGSNYPFTRPSSDIQYLLGDFYLSFPDDTCEHPYPFYVAWMYGFGTNSVTPPVGYPTPTHAHDILIRDENDVTVFDSTAAGVTYSSSVWGDPSFSRLTIHEWVDEDNYVVCRCTEHTAWSQADIDAGLDKTYDDYIVPTEVLASDGRVIHGGELDSRTYNKLPQRLNKIKVGLTDISGNIAFEEGYNISLSGTTETGPLSRLNLTDIGIDTLQTAVLPGKRTTNYITLSAVPGSGLGAFPSCEGVTSSSIVLRKLAGAAADEKGNIKFDQTGCLRYQRPVAVTSWGPPKTFTYYSPLLSATESKSAIEMLNDCGPCCDCEFFARTYQGLKRQWSLYQGIATDAESARNQYRLNVDRWHAQKACRELNPLSLALLSNPDCKVTHSAVFGNTSKCCLRNVHFRFTFYYYRGGQLISPPALEYFDCNRTELLGDPQLNGPEPYVLQGDYPVYEAISAYANPQSNTRITFRFCFPGCEEDDRVKIRTDVYWEGVVSNEEYPNYPSTESTCTYPDLTIDAETYALWSASSLGVPAYDVRFNKETKLITTNPLSAYCAQCYCEPSGSGSQSL
tara:strand:- start:5733 stop:7484 length:1752 start_codon:yes stop_codon:yes gene_type:complete